MNLSDEDLREIERGAPSGLLDSYSGIASLFLIVFIGVLFAAHHFRL